MNRTERLFALILLLQNRPSMTSRELAEHFGDKLFNTIVPRNVRSAKVIAAGPIERAVTLQGVRASAGARAAIEKAGGRGEA